MAEIYDERIAYKHGIEVPDNEVIELHGFCDCSACNYRKQYCNGLRNQVTLTIKDKNKLNEARKIITDWKCNSKQHFHKTTYLSL